MSSENNKIKLLHLMKTCDIGGVEKSTILYSNNLVNEFKMIGIYAHKGFFDDSGIINRKIKRFYPPSYILKKRCFIQNFTNLITVIKSYEITHIHYHQRIFIPFVFFIKLVLKKIKVIYSHHNIYDDNLNYLIIADKIIAFTSSVKNDLPKFQQMKTLVIPHGFNLHCHAQKLNFPVNFGFVGRFVKMKRILDLIKAFAIVNKNFPDSKLYLVGDGPQKPKIIQKIKTLDLIEKVFLIAPICDLNKVYQYINVLVLPSKTLEAFPLVLIEAMSLGIPVIINDNPTYSGIVENNYNGIIVTENLFEGMKRIATNNLFYQKLSRNAFQKSKEFDISEIIKRYIDEVYM